MDATFEEALATHERWTGVMERSAQDWGAASALAAAYLYSAG